MVTSAVGTVPTDLPRQRPSNLDYLTINLGCTHAYRADLKNGLAFGLKSRSSREVVGWNGFGPR